MPYTEDPKDPDGVPVFDPPESEVPYQKILGEQKKYLRKYHDIKMFLLDEKEKDMSNAVLNRNSPLNYQIGGNHYQDMPIQPIEFITKNKLSFLQGCIIKRIVRYNKEGGKGLQDLEKIKHEIDLIITSEDWK